MLDQRHRLRHMAVLARARAQAALVGAQLDLDIHPSVSFGRGARMQCQPGTTNRVRMGPGCRILDDVLILLKGGTVDFGPRVEVRRTSVLNVAGVFTCEGHNVFSYGNIVHCAEAITLEQYASTNEYCSLIDSTHSHDGDREFFYENTTSAPIHIGRNTWICNKATVLHGVTIGSNSVLSSHSVANRDIPSGVVAAGIPARAIAKRRSHETAAPG